MGEFLHMTAEQFRKAALEEGRLVLMPQKNKYHAVKTTVGDTTYDSRKEAHRGAELERLQAAHKIKGLEKQKEFILIDAFECRGIKYRKCSWFADFYYYDCGKGNWVAEDVKSAVTRKKPEYVIKKKLFIQRYPEIAFNEYL